MKTISALAFIGFLLLACGNLKETEEVASSTGNTAVATPAESKIIFLVLNISNDSLTDQNHIKIVTKTESSGKFKKEPQKHIPSENYLTIQHYENGQLINTTIIEHPLYKHIEYLDESSKLSVKHIELKKEDFFIRLQVTGNSTLKILEKRKDKPETQLTVLTL